jgi:dTDP-4-amino-4,6-dideoxygalactose transaminase
MAADYGEILASGIFTNGGPKEREFSRLMENWIGRDVAVSLISSATTGLQLACAAAFHQDRRYVLVPSFTFAAAPLIVRWCGYEPIFIDVEIETWQPSLSSAADALRSVETDVAGILLTNTFGVANSKIASWEVFAAQYDVPMVIDSAAGFGSAYPSGERLGARGACEVFSMHATKTLAVGEGGAISSRDHALIATIDRLKNFGFDASRQSVALGTNAKLSELAAAIGIRQMAAFSDRLRARQRVLGRYVLHLSGLGIEFQPLAELSALPFVSALLPESIGRDSLLAALDVSGVGCSAYYHPPVHRHPVFTGAQRAGDLRTSDDLSRRMISLPMADDLPNGVALTVSEHAKRILDGM